jgi:hypothetical protein
MAFQSEHQGTGNHGRVILLEDGVTFAPIDSKAVDMAYIESRELNRQEVAMVMDLPPSALQDMTHATFSNVVENMRSLYGESLPPRTTFMEDVVNWEVGRFFNGPKIMKFALATKLRGAFEQRAEAVAKLVQCGVYMPAEARQLFDLNVAGPEAEQLLIQGAMVPLGQAGQQQEQAAAAPPTDQGNVTHVPFPAGGGGTNVPTPATQKYVRDMTAWIGRGHSLQSAAREVIKKTGDQDGVREACEFLLERRIA